MNTCGIIAEYNPFHKGHLYHIKKTKELTHCDALIVILSSYFSQRGLPSILSSHNKTMLALEAGANLVIELPCCYAAQSADYFAQYAIESLNQFHIDTLCFGSETNNIKTLNNYLTKIETIQKAPWTSLNQNTYQNIHLKPNDILGIQYIKQCKKYAIQPVCIQRNDTFKSATQTRQDYFNGIPQFNDQYFLSSQNWQQYYPYLQKFLILSKPETLATYFLVNEGIEFRLIKNAKLYHTWDEFLKHSISKTYTKARIQRTCMFILLQITKEEMKRHNHFNHAIVLGFDTIGRKLLKKNKTSSIITKFKDKPDFLQSLDIKCQYLCTNQFHANKVIYYDRSM